MKSEERSCTHKIQYTRAAAVKRTPKSFATPNAAPRVRPVTAAPRAFWT